MRVSEIRVKRIRVVPYSMELVCFLSKILRLKVDKNLTISLANTHILADSGFF